jgi:hypothetical protein
VRRGVVTPRARIRADELFDASFRPPRPADRPANRSGDSPSAACRSCAVTEIRGLHGAGFIANIASARRSRVATQVDENVDLVFLMISASCGAGVPGSGRQTFACRGRISVISSVCSRRRNRRHRPCRDRDASARAG